MANLRRLLLDIYELNDRRELLPEDVVEAARPVDSPLHHRFEWDDSIAGEAYRKNQATVLIRSSRLPIPRPPGQREQRFVRSFVSNYQVDTEKRGYTPIEEVVQDEFATGLLLKELRREIANLKRRYGHLEEFVAIWREGAA
jgi:hypothetical protein